MCVCVFSLGLVEFESFCFHYVQCSYRDNIAAPHAVQHKNTTHPYTQQCGHTISQTLTVLFGEFGLGLV